MKNILLLPVLAVIFLSSCAMQSAMLMRPVDAQLAFVSPRNQAQLTSPVTIQLHMDGMQPAQGHDKERASTAIYLMVNKPIPALNQALPINADGVHVIKPGMRSISLELKPGQHRLQMIAMDQWFRPHIPPLISEIITINVKK